jgi:hypothetical protein
MDNTQAIKLHQHSRNASMKIINIDVYNTRILAFDSFKDFQRYIKKHTVVVSDEDRQAFDGNYAHGIGGILEYENPVDPERQMDYFIVVEGAHNISVVTHEALHVAMFMLHYIGVSYTVNEQEPLCYLVEYVVREYIRLFNIAVHKGI